MPVSLEMNDDIGVITLDDGKRNAINPTLLNALHGALDEAEQKAKCLIIKGRPGTFSAGFDLKFFASQPPEDIRKLVMDGGRLAVRLMKYPMPVIAAATGHGIAMGTFMMLACDFRYGIQGESLFGANETQNNMVIPLYAIELINERIPPQHRLMVAAEGRLFPSDIAKTIGILDNVLPVEKLEQSVLEHAEALAKTNTSAFVQNRNLIRRKTLMAIEDSLT